MSDTTRVKSAVPGAPPVPVDHVVAMLRERLYGAISCLALLAVLTRYTEGDTSAWTRMIDTDTAVWVAQWILFGELALIALLAVRRTRLPWWQQIVTVVLLAGVGVLVIGIKILAH